MLADHIFEKIVWSFWFFASFLCPSCCAGRQSPLPRWSWTWCFSPPSVSHTDRQCLGISYDFLEELGTHTVPFCIGCAPYAFMTFSKPICSQNYMLSGEKAKLYWQEIFYNTFLLKYSCITSPFSFVFPYPLSSWWPLFLWLYTHTQFEREGRERGTNM